MGIQLNTNCTNAGDRVEAVKAFLVGSVEAARSVLGGCPSAQSLTAIDKTDGRHVIIVLPCKQWGCRHCGEKRAFLLGIRCELADPNKFITLTVSPKHFLDPREAYDQTRRKISDLTKLIRKEKGEFEYMRILEITKAGWPHYHMLARAPYIQQKWLSDTWAGMTGAVIVDIRKIQKKDNVFRYVAKYLCKQTYIPWTNRRVCWSHKFFPQVQKTEHAESTLVEKTLRRIHPAEYLSTEHDGAEVQQISPACWKISKKPNRPGERRWNPYTEQYE